MKENELQISRVNLQDKNICTSSQNPLYDVSGGKFLIFLYLFLAEVWQKDPFSVLNTSGDNIRTYTLV